MKKTLMRLGVLAAALALTFVFVSCAQPTEEGSSGPNAPTIIRLYLDRDDATLVATDTLEIRVGEDLLIQAATYPYPANLDSALVQENAGRDDTVPLSAADRSRVVAIPRDRGTGAPTVLKYSDPKKKYLVSGIVDIKDSVLSGNGLSTNTGGTSIQVDAKGIYYVDIPLINQTIASKDRGSVFAGSVSGYVEMDISSATTSTR